MHRYRLVLAGLVALALVVGLAVRLWPPNQAVATASAPAARLARPIRGPIAGTASCAGRACHGSLEPTERVDGLRLNEYTAWLTQDPHAGAYQVLLNPRSVDIARRLGIDKAHESQRCLVCHTTSEAASLPDDHGAAALIRQERTMGVGCEACHGNALSWLDAHVGKGWDRRGIVNLGDPETLARQCAGCHVGAPPQAGSPVGRDVNHDLLAAGHPRLAFELSAFFANLPPHWKQAHAPESQRWAVGEIVAAEAALELLRHRAASTDAPWPEFAEYDCFGCHHDLTDPAWRQQQKSARGRGAVAWGSWYFAIPRALAADRLSRPLRALDELALIMESPGPPRRSLEQQSGQALAELRGLKDRLAGWPEAPEFARARMIFLRADGRLAHEPTWDAAEQTYLSLQALNRVAKDARWQTRLDALVDVRAFRPGWDSPASRPQPGFVPARFFEMLRGEED